VKLARRVARRIEDDILAARLPVGQIFASETELRTRYGVSRAVLREAIRLVEHHGLAAMRRGIGGGLVLREPDAGPLTQAVVVYLEYVGTSVDDLLAVRRLLEPVSARVAAQTLTEDKIAILRETVAQEQADTTLAPGGHDRVHVVLGRIGGNRVLGLFIDVLVQLTSRYATLPPPPNGTALSRVNAASGHAHARIADAIVAGNVASAEHRSVVHLDAMREWLLSAAQHPIRRRETTEPGPVVPVPGETLAETVARRLMADVAASGVPAGTILGSEPQLQARMGVSRSAFREAVRLLEYHSVARMRRGPHGGLVVTRPDPSACVDAMSVYLDYANVTAAELRVVRDALELGALETLVEQHTDPDLAERLRAAQRVNGSTPGSEVATVSDDFHLRLADLTGNPVISLFLRILVAVWTRHSAHPSTDPGDHGAAATAVVRAHDRILDAIISGDLPVARHRMRRHLEALDDWWL
jgi:DNA-binding FadR family transcriptional regulator